jgi:hypothetical protein
MACGGTALLFLLLNKLKNIPWPNTETIKTAHSHCDEYEDDHLLGCCVVYSGTYWPRFERACCFHYHSPDDGGSQHLWNIGQYPPDYTKQHPRRQPPKPTIVTRFPNHWWAISCPTTSTIHCFLTADVFSGSTSRHDSLYVTSPQFSIAPTKWKWKFNSLTMHNINKYTVRV